MIPNTCTYVEPILSPQEVEWVHKIRQNAQVQDHSGYSLNPFNLLRWAYAYEGDLTMAAKKYRRHLKIRKILELDRIHNLSDADGLDEAADEYAPVEILGQVAHDDNRVLLLERSGKYDLQEMLQHVRTSAFMLNRFRLMERILSKIQENEKRTGKISSAVLIIDLEGLSFQANLIGFISGPYRIMWGTLIEQYPYLISKIMVINSPTFMNVLWTACSAFIPSEYRRKIYLMGSDWKDKITEHIALPYLPISYGGYLDVSIRNPVKFRQENLVLAYKIDGDSMETMSIPAGGFVIQTFYLKQNEVLEFYMIHDQEFTMNIFYSPEKKNITNISEDIETMEEAYHGCELPGIPSIDFWKWIVPYTGFYYAIYGNEKAWIMSVPFKYQIFQIHSNGSRIKVNPIPFP